MEHQIRTEERRDKASREIRNTRGCFVCSALIENSSRGKKKLYLQEFKIWEGWKEVIKILRMTLALQQKQKYSDTSK